MRILGSGQHNLRSDMTRKVSGPEIERVVQLLGRLPGLGPRSARKAALALIKRRNDLLVPLAEALADAVEKIVECPSCGNLDTVSPCSLCQDPRRDRSMIVVVEEIGDLWALERAGVVNGLYHVLGGHLSPLDGIGPDRLNIARLIERAEAGEVAGDRARPQRHGRGSVDGALSHRAFGAGGRRRLASRSGGSHRRRAGLSR